MNPIRSAASHIGFRIAATTFLVIAILLLPESAAANDGHGVACSYCHHPARPPSLRELLIWLTTFAE